MSSFKYLFRKPDGKGGWKYYYKNPTIKVKSKFDTELVFEVFNRVGFEERVGSFPKKSEKLKKKCEEIENKISYRKDAEYCGILDENGNVIFTKKGNSENIEFEIDEANKIKNQKILTHNHTKERGISPDDIFLSLFLGIEEIRAVYEDKIFSFKISYKEKSKNYEELKLKNKIIINEIKKETDEAQSKLQELIFLNKLTRNNANIVEQDFICDNLLANNVLSFYLNMRYVKNEK